MKRTSLLLLVFTVLSLQLIAADDWMTKATAKNVPHAHQSIGTGKFIRTRGAEGVPPAVNPIDAYKAGEMSQATYQWSYWTAIADSVKDQVKQNRALVEKINASKDTLDAYDTYTAQMVTLPWGQGWSKWSPADQKTWQTSDLWSKFVTSLKKDLAAPQAFTAWALGFDSLRLAWTIPKNLQDGVSIADEMQEITYGVDDMAARKGEDTFSSLTPDVQAAIQKIAALNSKIKNPIGDPVNNDDVNALAQAANTIRQAARNGKLFS